MPTDFFTFVGASLQGYGQTADELLGRMDLAGVGRAVVCPTKPRGYHLGPANDEAAALARTSPRLVPFARVDPLQGEDAVRELERAVRALGARGLFLHPWEESFRISSPVVDPVAEAASALRLPLLIATGYPWVSEAPQVGELARRYPRLRIIMTHGGQINISGLGQTDAWHVLQERTNVCIETSGVYRQDFLEEVVGTFGPERVLFGSSSPIMDMRLEIARVQQARVPEADRALMLQGNAERLLRASEEE
ncbi:MAG: amidohydrolase family protein [Chloroflexota bacterium]|nr:amidohydrolase family protein [Chloroflexota bacterium]